MKDEKHLGKDQPRIDTAEKQRGANNPRPLPKDEEERAKHPGYPG